MATITIVSAFHESPRPHDDQQHEHIEHCSLAMPISPSAIRVTATWAMLTQHYKSPNSTCDEQFPKRNHHLSLAYEQFCDARIQAFKSPIVRVPGGFCGGLVLRDPTHAPLRHTRKHKPVDQFRNDETYDNKLFGEYFYLGPVTHHFGHFMAEMVHRAILYKTLGLNLKYIMVTSDGLDGFSNYDKLPSFVKEILAYLDINNNNIVLLNSNTIVEKLHVFEAGSDLSGGAKNGYLQLLRDFSVRKLNHIHGNTIRPEKIYVSRSALSSEGSILGESYFESYLSNDGFTIFRPEEMRFSAQLDYYYKSKTIIFTDGSACHGAELLGESMMDRVILMPRRGDTPVGTFEKVLKPRSRSFTLAKGCIDFLGTPFALPNGRPAIYRGISVININETAHFFRSINVAEMSSISLSKYIEHVQADFEKFISSRKARSINWKSDFENNLRKNFQEKVDLMTYEAHS